MPDRLPITKTPKCYVGGKFIRSESGRVFPLTDRRGEFVAYIPQCTRKDLRNAVEAAAAAMPGWAGRTAYNRGQILYRLAEMLEPRASELVAALTIGGATPAAAAREVTATIDRIVHYAGWCDKFEQLLGNVNPVASPHFNFTVTEHVGVIGLLAPDEAPLLALITLLLPVITSGNTVIALASETAPYASIVLGEMLAVSDLPRRRRQPPHRLPQGTRAHLRYSRPPARRRRRRLRRRSRHPPHRRRRERPPHPSPPRRGKT